MLARTLKLILATLALLCTAAPAFATTIVSPAVYVSPSGNDTTGNGTIGNPFATLHAALTNATYGTRATGTKTIYERGGTYSPTSVERLNNAADANLNILGYPGETPVIDGTNVTTGLSTSGTTGACSSSSSTYQCAYIDIEQPNVTLRWTKIQNFQTGCIIGFAKVANGVIDSNDCENSNSSQWNEAGIFLPFGADGWQITHNKINNCGYDCILVLASSASYDFSNMLISNNDISNCMQTYYDGGCIHVDDRGHTATGPGSGSTGWVISNNRMHNWGGGTASATHKSSMCIYLDDWSSNGTIKGNLCYGTVIPNYQTTAPSYVIEFHGGDTNLVYNNIFDVSSMDGFQEIVYQSEGSTLAMPNNLFQCNINYSTSFNGNIWHVTSSTITPTPPTLGYNLYGGLTQWTNATNTTGYGDSASGVGVTAANVGFNNPAGGDYSFKNGYPPSFCTASATNGYPAVWFNPATVGPQPNVLVTGYRWRGLRHP